MGGEAADDISVQTLVGSLAWHWVRTDLLASYHRCFPRANNSECGDGPLRPPVCMRRQ
jgi:hypothetical protein